MLRTGLRSELTLKHHARCALLCKHEWQLGAAHGGSLAVASCTCGSSSVRAAAAAEARNSWRPCQAADEGRWTVHAPLARLPLIMVQLRLLLLRCCVEVQRRRSVRLHGVDDRCTGTSSGRLTRLGMHAGVRRSAAKPP